MSFYTNPNDTIAVRSDGKIMEAPTQAEFEACCCGPSTDCAACAENCDGGGGITVTVTGCASISGTMTRIEVCYWRLYSGSFEIALHCVNDVWEFYITSDEQIPCHGSTNPALICNGDHPTGSFSYLDNQGNMAYVVLS